MLAIITDMKTGNMKSVTFYLMARIEWVDEHAQFLVRELGEGGHGVSQLPICDQICDDLPAEFQLGALHRRHPKHRCQ